MIKTRRRYLSVPLEKQKTVLNISLTTHEIMVAGIQSCY